ncbi:MAG: hypothetical protein UX09_C0032G0004 [Candidatus Uhrbacteria bacterium GW2011_GWE2_45_35]|uniref:Uncharacterized protein n=2 Tax=Candidatus Uhriibacteriota TaxID=1752732 RepID=A0A0G1MEP0_9BACT|nr:MAG: hypothetical protein UW63_C0026G0004 [Candidatus Uhrbacteria bacterium GW2011_GWF2_44_350]KKU07271.1 MAG: hypothetical protein UX09_C0032G0004 [Candidatus Uhrbacteria bacterium GW2011_GWE2_45_35]HBR80417.1 hypothetical protein [Candidatus Uhrbacteria bacterium]HCU31180.1 hypothetical protein [Candidatus Uhrbacteria bacterium]
MDFNKLKEFVDKVDQMKKQDKMDLSSDQDLSIAVMNLISIEEHFFFTAQKTGKNEYLDLLNEVRAMRKELLQRLIKQYEGEVWCISKHLLAASMRLMEVGTKALGQGKKEDAEDLFKKSFDLYSLFWGLNMKMINLDDVKKTSGDSEPLTAEEVPIKKIDDLALNKNDTEKKGFVGKLGELVKKAVDCCIE